MGDQREVTRAVLEHAAQIAARVKARALLLAADPRALDDLVDLRAAGTVSVEVVAALDSAAIEQGVPADAKVTVLRVPELAYSRVGRIKLALLIAISKGLLRRGELVVCATGAFGRPGVDTVVTLEVGREGELLGSMGDVALPAVVKPEVFERALDLASRIAVEGREGKPLGTIFVLGDEKEILPYTKQLIMNPFRGYAESERGLLDPNLEETIKEFAALDGAFVIRGDGVVLSAGTYLRTGPADAQLEQGLGARHAAAIGITAATDAVAIVVSSSTGAVRVYMGGKLLAAIERPSARRVSGGG